MNPRLLALAKRHGALQSRIAEQRQRLAQQAEPLERALAQGDVAMAGLAWLKRHPGSLAAATATFVVLRPRRAFRWAKQGFLLWRGWQAVRNALTR